MSINTYILCLLFVSVHVVFAGMMLVYLRRRASHLYSRIHYLETRLNYHAVALAENEILPMPWELEELEEIQKQVKLDHEDNVVYMKSNTKETHHDDE
tara:strand:- start:195 stop:488 length:294 start_codon:yes stop_codon:yes gene_type:complete